MDIQKMMDAMSKTLRDDRSKYHLTLGQAIKELEKLDASKPIRYDYLDTAPGEAMSYRGYYSDLCFDFIDTETVGGFLKKCKEALGNTFTGYKGGYFYMDKDTPLWVAEYGCCGRAIMGITTIGDEVVLITKELD